MTSEEFRNNPMFLRNQFTGDGVFEMPKLKKDKINLEKVALIGYDKLSEKETDKFVHFFLDDYKFEVMWNDPEPRIERLKKYPAVLSPNYSLYTEMPLSIKVYNTFRSRWCGAYFQSRGIKTIPTVAWGEPNTFWFCFDGIEKGSTVAVSTLGVRAEKSLFMQGYNEMLRKIKPSAVICYGKPFEEMKGNIIEVDYAETNRLKKKYTSNEPAQCSPDRFEGDGKYYFKNVLGFVCTDKGMGEAGDGDNNISGNLEQSSGGSKNESDDKPIQWTPKKEADKRFIGEPNTKRQYTKPNGEVIIDKYGNDGRAIAERHMTDHHQPWAHSNPHDHEVDWSGGHPQLRGIYNYRPEKYPNGAPEFKRREATTLNSQKLIDEDSFESVEDFKFSMKCGGEVQFNWKDKAYSITHRKNGIAFSEALKQETEVICKDADEVLSLIIGDEKLSDIITQVHVTERTI